MDFDCIIVGAGQGGGPLAADLAAAGWQVALIEADAVGGTCINRGCTPTKTMVASAKMAYEARRAEPFGVEIDQVEVNLPVVRRRKQDIVETFRSGSEAGLANVELIYGEATFVGPKEIEVNGQRLKAETIILNVGCRPRADYDLPHLNSTTIMELDEIPEHLLVVGAGYVALEFAQMFRRFGSEVTILSRSEQLLKREDADVSEEMMGILTDEGIQIVLGADMESIGNYNYSHLLLATGRQPNTEGLNLEETGVQIDEQGYIKVDESLRTSASGIYAIGDCKGGPQFTHISYDDYRILRRNLIEHGHATTNGRLVPYCLYTDPQLGRVGLTEEQAIKNGYNVAIAKMPMNHVARAIETDQQRGLMKVVIDADNDLILGCAILGTEGGELMSMIEIAMMGGLPYTALKDAIFAHPTLAEGFNNLFQKVTQPAKKSI